MADIQTHRRNAQRRTDISWSMLLPMPIVCVCYSLKYFFFVRLSLFYATTTKNSFDMRILDARMNGFIARKTATAYRIAVAKIFFSVVVRHTHAL